MKKRLISLLLTVVMLVSLFSGLTVSASADANVATVTLNSGDTVLGLCQKYGIDYYTYRNLIMTLNGITDESQFSKLAVGAKVVLPVSNTAAAALAGGSSSVTGGGTVGGSTGSGWTNGSVVQLPTGDHPAYYLVTYTVQKGDTIGSIYASMGLSYKTYQNQIVKLNNLANINSVQAGRTLVLPTTSPGIANTTYTTIMAHTMKAGESAYNIICGSYGLDYNSNLQKLRALNNRDDLGKFRVGELLYIPVAGVVDTNTNVGGGNSGSSTSGNVNNSGYFNLVSQTAENGTFDLQVNGKTVKTASAGQLVSVVATPETGYAVDSIKVVKVGDAATSVTVSNSSFVMPSYSVTVSVTFKKAVQSEIKVDAALNGGVVAMVNSARVDKAYAGAQVEVKATPATGFMLDKIRVTYNDYRDTIAVENGKFTMPSFPVTVSATFKVDPDYKPSMGNNIYTDITNGKLITKVGATEVTRAKTGETVTIEVTPDENYTLESISVYYDGFNKTAELDKMSFIMPGEPVTIVAVVKPTNKATFAIKKVANSEGSFKTLVDGKEVDTAKVGQTVTVQGTSNKSFYYYITTVTKTGDSSVLVYQGNDGKFTMPDFPVTVSVKFYIYHNVTLSSKNGINGSYNVTSAITGGVVTRCAAGAKLNVNISKVASGMSVGKIIVTYADGSTHELIDERSFIMPDCDVSVAVEFNKNGKLIANAPTVDGVAAANCGNSYTILGKNLKDKDTASAQLTAGKNNSVVVVPYCAVGYVVDKISYSYQDAAGEWKPAETVIRSPLTGNYQFIMPDSPYNVKVDVAFKKIPSYAIEAKYGLDNQDHKMGYVEVMTKMGEVKTAAADADIVVRFFPGSGFATKLSAVNVNWVSADETTSGTIPCEVLHSSIIGFKMPTPASLGVESYKVVIDLAKAFSDTRHSVDLKPVDLDADGKYPKGTIKVSDDDGATIYSAADLTTKKFPMGTKITIISESREGYSLNTTDPIIVTRNDDGTKVPVNTVAEGSKFTFTMPLSDVSISAVYGESTYGIIKIEPEHGSFTVPLQGNWNVAVPITEIVPEKGYHLACFRIKYTSADGEYREEELAGSQIKAFTGLPKSAVTVEAVFEADKNPLTIKYSYDPNEILESSNYKVDLVYDDTTVDITRGAAEDAVTVDKGIPTGKTVRVSRNMVNIDHNYKIGQVWAELDDGTTKIAVNVTTTEDGQISFVMPYLDGKSFILHVVFERVDGDNSYIVNPSVENATVTVPDGVTLGEEAEVTISPKAGYNAPAAVNVKYTDMDGKEKVIVIEEASLTTTADGGVKFKLPADYPLIDVTKPVVIEATCEAILYNITATEVTGVKWEVKENAKLGEEVIVKLTVDPDNKVTKVTMNGAELKAEEDGSYKFTMPGEDVTLIVTCEPAAKSKMFKLASSDKGLTLEDLNISEKDGTYTIKTDKELSTVSYESDESEEGSVTIELTKIEGGYSFTIDPEKPLSEGGTITFS